MNRKIDGVIFDKDGTLIDFDVFWVSVTVAAMKNLLKQLGKGEEPLAEILSGFGIHNGETDSNSVLCKGTYGQMAEIFCEVLARHGDALSSEAIEKQMVEAYRKHVYSGTIKPTCPRLREVLSALKRQGKRLAVITTDHSDVTSFCLERLGIADLLDRVYTDDGIFPTKPHPAAAEDFCRVFHLEAKNVLMVGDTVTDVHFAKNAGLQMVGVAKSEKNREILKKETETVLSDLSQLLF